MDEFNVAPVIKWKISNFASTCTKLSPPVFFMHLKWKLRLTQSVESNSQYLRLSLECLNATENLPSLGIDTCILNGTSKCMSYLTSAYRYRQCCIWSNPISNVCKQLGQQKDLTLLVTITPSELEKERSDETRRTPCVVSLQDDVRLLYNSDVYSDFTLKCGGRDFRVHKAILAARSEYFAGMFRSGMEEVKQGYAEFKDVDPDILDLVLGYLYSGELNVEAKDRIGQIYDVAALFDVRCLKVQCGSLLMSSYTRDEKDEQPENEKEADVPQPEPAVNNKISAEEKIQKILKDLFLSFEWETLYQEAPELATEMCLPLFVKKILV